MQSLAELNIVKMHGTGVKITLHFTSEQNYLHINHVSSLHITTIHITSLILRELRINKKKGASVVRRNRSVGLAVERTCPAFHGYFFFYRKAVKDAD